MSRTVPTVLACDESDLLSMSCMACFPSGQIEVPACQRPVPYILCISESWQGSADIKHEERHESHVPTSLVTAGGRFALIHISRVCLQRMWERASRHPYAIWHSAATCPQSSLCQTSSAIATHTAWPFGLTGNCIDHHLGKRSVEQMWSENQLLQFHRLLQWSGSSGLTTLP